jgi:hypothetical protein
LELRQAAPESSSCFERFGVNVPIEITRRLSESQKIAQRHRVRFHMEHSAILKLENPNDKPMRVWFEPWGDFRDLQPGQQFDLEFHADVSGEPEVRRIEEGFVICAWPSATLTVKSAGSEVVNFILPVPDVPSGMKVSSFLEHMFGKTSNESET